MKNNERFASRWGIVFAGLGMAVGTGNIWRFPRIVAQQGGGAFIVAWIIFLFLWSIPLLVIEISIGKKTRLGVIGSFSQILGKNLAWMGTFVAFVTTAIMFYYSVVTGWCLKYFFATLFQDLIGKSSESFWSSFALSKSWEPVFFHFLALGIGTAIIYSGVVKGIERINKILIPSLFFLLLVAGIRAVTLPGASEGLNFLFTVDLHHFGNYKIWLQALTQSAWSTGAGWGLILTYAIYTRQKENSILTATTLGFGNSLASLLAACAIIPTVFSYFSLQNLSHENALAEMVKNNEGLTFIWIPKLFAHIPAGNLFMALFFLALSFAAFSSLISMIELVTRIFIDAGLTRKKSVMLVGGAGFLLGVPSAISMGIFKNQDWVWSMGLLVSGLFFIIAVMKFGPTRFRKEFISTTGKKPLIGKWFNIVVTVLLPLQFLAMIVWWFYDSYTSSSGKWFSIIDSYSVGTVLFQWGVAILIFILFNKTITKKIRLNNNDH